MSEERVIAGRYRLLERLGSGGSGVVWRSFDERLRRTVAVKQVHVPGGLTGSQNDELVRRTMREGRIAARLQHPQLITVYDVVEDNGQPYLIMEHFPSKSLALLGTMEFPSVARVGAEAAEALAAAHESGVVHRDIKPANVLVGTEDSSVKITDFGISRVVEDLTATMTGMFAGTPAYLAPEVAKGGQATFASDVYSLGATLYAAVEGQPPAGDDNNQMGLLFRVASGEINPPTQAGELTDLLLSLLSTEPRNRPTMSQANQALAAISRRNPAPSLVMRPVVPTTAKNGTATPDTNGATPGAPATTQSSAAAEQGSATAATQSAAGATTTAEPASPGDAEPTAAAGSASGPSDETSSATTLAASHATATQDNPSSEATDDAGSRATSSTGSGPTDSKPATDSPAGSDPTGSKPATDSPSDSGSTGSKPAATSPYGPAPTGSHGAGSPSGSDPTGPKPDVGSPSGPSPTNSKPAAAGSPSGATSTPAAAAGSSSGSGPAGSHPAAPSTSSGSPRPTNASPAAGTPGTTPPSTKQAPKERRRLRAIAIAAGLVAVAVVAALVTTLMGQDDEPATPNQAGDTRTSRTTTESEPTTEDPTTTTTTKTPPTTTTNQPVPPANQPPPQQGSATPAAAVTDYYALMPGNRDQAWNRLTPKFQTSPAGGKSGYDNFWSKISSVTASEVAQTGDNVVEVTLLYTYNDGRRIRERHRYTLVNQNGTWLIDTVKVLSTRAA